MYKQFLESVKKPWYWVLPQPPALNLGRFLCHRRDVINTVREKRLTDNDFIVLNYRLAIFYNLIIDPIKYVEIFEVIDDRKLVLAVIANY